MVGISVRVSVAVKRHHDHDNCYKGKHSIGVAWLQFRGSAHHHHGGAWQQSGRHGAGEVAESPTSCRQQSGLSHSTWLEHIWDLKVHLPRDTLLPTSTPTPTRPHLLIVPFSFKPLHSIPLSPKTYNHIIMQKCIQSNFKGPQSL